MSDTHCDIVSLVHGLPDSVGVDNNVVLYNIFPHIVVNVSNTYMEVYLLYENIIAFKNLRACSKLWLWFLNSATVGTSLHIVLQEVREERYEDAQNMC